MRGKFIEVILRAVARVPARRRTGVVLGLFGSAVLVQATVVLAGGAAHTKSAPTGSAPTALATSSGHVYVGHSYKNDVSPALRSSAPIEAAMPMQAVDTGQRMYCMVS